MSKGESKDALQSLETQVDRLRSLKTQLDNAIADVDDSSQQLTARSTEVRREIRDVFSKHILAMQGKERQLEGELQALITTKQLNLATHRETLLSQLVELCRQLDEADSVLHGGTKQEITACKAAVEAFMSGALPQSKLKPAEATHIELRVNDKDLVSGIERLVSLGSWDQEKVHPASCVAHGAGLQSAMCNVAAEFVVALRTRSGHKRPHGGDSLSVRVRPLTKRNQSASQLHKTESVASGLSNENMDAAKGGLKKFNSTPSVASSKASNGASPTAARGKGNVTPAHPTIARIESDTGESVKSVKIAVKDNDDGTYSVTCTYMLPGRYRISVKVSGQHIAGSPYTVDVHSVRNYRTVRTLARYLTSPNDSGMYRLPSGVATDHFGRVLVAEAGNFQLVVVDRDGRVERCFGKRGRAEGEFRDIQGIAVGADGSVFVADLDNKCVHVFDSAFRYIRKLTRPLEVQAKPAGGKALSLEALALTDFNDFSPIAVATHSDGRVAVGCLTSRKVHLFTENGVLIKAISTRGSNPATTVKMMGGLAISSDTDELYITDSDQCCIHVYTMAGEHTRSFGKPGLDEGMLDGPMGICVDDQGHVFVVEKGAGRLTIFSRDGKFVTSIGGKHLGPKKQIFKSPAHVAVGRDAAIFVTDKGLQQVLVF